MTSTVRTAEQIRTEISTLTAELATISGEPLRVWDGTLGDLADTPPGGALLHVSWAVSDHSYEEWYPNAEAAKAALLALALDNGTTPDADGWRVDLTSPGCHQRRAWVERRSTTAGEASGWSLQNVSAESFEVRTPLGTVAFRVGQDDAGGWGVVHAWSSGMAYLAADPEKSRAILSR